MSVHGLIAGVIITKVDGPVVGVSTPSGGFVVIEDIDDLVRQRDQARDLAAALESRIALAMQLISDAGAHFAMGVEGKCGYCNAMGVLAGAEWTGWA